MAGLYTYLRTGKSGLLTTILITVIFSFFEPASLQAAPAARKYIITASAGPGGSISPSGSIRVDKNKDLTFTITPDPEFEVLDVLVDGSSIGPVPTYTFENVTSNHTISASFIKKLIRVLDVTIPDEPMKIGDMVPVTLAVEDDAGVSYTLSSGSVGGYLMEGFTRISSTVYQSHFIVYQGGNSYEASEDIPVSGVVISNGVKQSEPLNLTISQGNDPIDAEAPGVLKMEVPSIEVGVGGVVKVTITADGSGYSAGTGTVVNGISLESTRVSFMERSMGLYELSYTVASGDNDVSPGTLQASVVLLDAAGNRSDAYSQLVPNSLEIYTTLPEATLSAVPEICEGDETDLSVYLSGRPPWSFTLEEGSTSTNFADIEASTFKIEISPGETTSYRISSVTDVNGVENTGSGTIQVTVYDRTEVEIINLEAGYSVNAEPVKLEANVPGGEFSGPGVISSTGYFYPELAGTADSPHTISYSYVNDNGCTSMTSKLVYVSGGEAAILIPKNAFCSSDDPFRVSVMNVSGTTGSFSLLNSEGESVAGLTDHGDRTATIDPALLNAGSYTIEYRYTDGTAVSLTESFSVEIISQPVILNLDDGPYCQNAPPFILQSDPEGMVFEGPGVSGNISDGFIFNPWDAGPGDIEIFCNNVSENGCSASTSQNVRVLYVPEVKFGLSTACIPEGGEIVSFNNQTSNISSVETWTWDFDDPDSGEENRSNLPDPTHFYREPGQRKISLTATTYDGCVATYVLDSVIDSKPLADFTWSNECFNPGSEVAFFNRTVYGYAAVDTILWTFKTSDGTVLDEVGPEFPTDTVTFQFSTAGSYHVELYTTNEAGCSGKANRELILRPVIKLAADGYDERFDQSEGSWTIHSENQAKSWVWDIPDFEGYTGEPNDKAWYTRLPAGAGEYMEQSWIQSPCFDLTGMDRPLIRLDIMRSFVPHMDGAVLQYRDVVEEGWKTVGEDTPGIEWYDANSIYNLPGGGSTGWGAVVFDPDTGWVTAAHDLDEVTGKSDVSFRIAIATGGQTYLGNQGFAVDNVVIAERIKLSVLEHFTDYSNDSSRIADEIINAVKNRHPKDIIDLQYHLSEGGMDPMYLNNPYPSSTRSVNYGVPGLPYSILSGGAYPYHRYDLPALRAGGIEDHVRTLSLEIPEFDVDLTVDWSETELAAQTTVTCKTDKFDDNIQLYLVVFETSVSGYAGNDGSPLFRNVVLDMLPSPAGKLLGDKWVRGKSDVRTQTWIYAPYVEDIDDLAVAAFVQDRSSNRVLQAAVAYKDPMVDLPDPTAEYTNLAVYPNPAATTLFVDPGFVPENNGVIELVDLSGKVVLKEHVPAGNRVVRLNISHLNRGIYLLRWIDPGQVRGVSKVVKILQ
ncbi:MAG TPA: T9SS type A sorting domain-containing protein [Bacteroides sp.]|nr:T9SS type A sorting domain-containing protein [Bacteroides sp.]